MEISNSHCGRPRFSDRGLSDFLYTHRQGQLDSIVLRLMTRARRATQWHGTLLAERFALPGTQPWTTCLATPI